MKTGKVLKKQVRSLEKQVGFRKAGKVFKRTGKALEK